MVTIEFQIRRYIHIAHAKQNIFKATAAARTCKTCLSAQSCHAHYHLKLILCNFVSFHSAFCCLQALYNKSKMRKTWGEWMWARTGIRSTFCFYFTQKLCEKKILANSCCARKKVLLWKKRGNKIWKEENKISQLLPKKVRT